MTILQALLEYARKIKVSVDFCFFNKIELVGAISTNPLFKVVLFPPNME